MLKILFVLALLMTGFLGIRILKILVQDLDRLTGFGYGYLAGQVILLLFFFSVSLVTGSRVYKQHREVNAKGRV